VQVSLGHASTETTNKYLHVRNAHLPATPSPIDVLGTCGPRLTCPTNVST
jgi:hypothetical protein